jgi:electron transfer flavoprotein beta subunit
VVQILACMKWVALRPEIDPVTGAVSSDDRFSGASPADRTALEWALRLAAAVGGTVTALTVGEPGAEPLLRDALAAGAARAIRVDGPADADSRAVAVAIAELCQEIDLVVCGHLSLDRGSGSVPAFVGHELAWHQALGLVAAAATEDGWVVERRLDQGRREQLHLIGPGVLSFERGPELRRAPLSGTLAAGTATIDVRPMPPVTPSEHRPTVVGTGPYRPRSKVKPAPSGSTRDRVLDLLGVHDGSTGAERHHTDPATAARLLVDRLVAWGYLEAEPASDTADGATGRSLPHRAGSGA